ncbi:MAG: polysaccharide biosynthesis tyrosine autokinase [Paludibacter sp.]|jgi:capsular exopolysaccharide synthesis family protein|nr:polysaccharide biosynthesis tyrosine autokinase [Paludibacter sp.]
MENNNNNNNIRKPEPINIRELLVKYIAKWYWFAISLFVCMALAVFYIISTVPTYKVQTTILIRQDNANTGFSPAALFEKMNISAFSKVVDDEMEILRSHELMKSSIKELNLQSDYYVKKRISFIDTYPNKPIEVILPENFLDTLSATVTITLKPNGKSYKVLLNYNNKIKEKYELSNFGKALQTPIGTIEFDKGATFDVKKQRTYKIEFFPLYVIADNYCQSVSVTAVSKRNNVVGISMVAQNTAKASDLLTKMVNIYNLDAMVDKNMIASSSKVLIEERIRLIQNELVDVENNMEEYRKNNQLTDINLEAATYVGNSSDYGKRITDTETQLGLVNYLFSILKNETHSFELIPNADFINGLTFAKQGETNKNESASTLSNLISDYNLLLIERERLLRSSSRENPVIQEMEQRLGTRRSAIFASLESLKKGLDISLKDLKSKNSEFTNKIVKLPGQERQLTDIKRQQTLKQELYLFLLQKYEENAIALASVFPTSKTLDNATVSLTPEAPKKPFAALIALLLGIGLPVVVIYIMDMFNNKIVDFKQFTKKINLPALGSVARHKGRNRLLVSDKKNAEFLEMFRALRTNLLLSVENPNKQVILVTSSIKGEGKTTVAANLALAFALLDKRTAFVGLDIRQNSVAEYFDLPERKGVAAYLQSAECTLADITQHSPAHPNLDLIPAGAIPENPTELLASERINQLFTELQKKYDYVIIDSSAVGVYSDTYLLNSQIDSTVFVLRYNFSPKTVSDLLLEIENKNKLKNISLVFNGIEENKI